MSSRRCIHDKWTFFSFFGAEVRCYKSLLVPNNWQPNKKTETHTHTLNQYIMVYCVVRTFVFFRFFEREAMKLCIVLNLATVDKVSSLEIGSKSHFFSKCRRGSVLMSEWTRAKPVSDKPPPLRTNGFGLVGTLSEKSQAPWTQTCSLAPHAQEEEMGQRVNLWLLHFIYSPSQMHPPPLCLKRSFKKLFDHFSQSMITRMCMICHAIYIHI